MCTLLGIRFSHLDVQYFLCRFPRNMNGSYREGPRGLGSHHHISADSHTSLSPTPGKRSEIFRLANSNVFPGAVFQLLLVVPDTEQKVPGLSSNFQVLFGVWNSKGLQGLLC